MAVLKFTRCAYCGREGRSLFVFVLLVEVCRKAGIKLKSPTSVHWHESCARRANAAFELRRST